MKTLQFVLVVLILYVFTAGTVYRFRHPQLTESQLFLKLPEALLWRK